MSFGNITRRLAEWLEKQVAGIEAVTNPLLTQDTVGGVKKDEEAHDKIPATWAVMRVKQAPLTRFRVFNAKGTKRKPMDSGHLLRYPQRFCVDKAVFSNHRAKQGGTILVDVSASNYLSKSELETILDTAPAATVAVYCASRSKKLGEVTIVGRHNMRAAKFNLISDHNLIDGPALRWLAKNKGPRIWLTDGKVTGLSPSGDRVVSKKLRQECTDICRQFRIHEVRNVEEVKKILV